MKTNFNHLYIYLFLVLTVLFISGCNDAQDSEVPIPIEKNTTQVEDINLTQEDDNTTSAQDENLTQNDESNTTLNEDENVTQEDDNTTYTQDENLTQNDESNTTLNEDENVTQEDDNTTYTQDENLTQNDESNTTQNEDENITQVNDTNTTYTQDENLTQSDANTTLPIVSKLPTTLKSILITQRGVTKTINLYQAEVSSYTIPNLPSWALLDVNTGILSVEHNVTGHGLYDIELTDTNGTTKSYENALRISIYPKLEMLQDYAGTLTPETPTSIAPAPSTVIHTTPQFFHNPDKNSWTVCLPYYAAYTSYQQIMTVDLSTGALKVDDKTSVATASWHMFKAVPGPGSKTFIGAQGGDITRVLRGGFQHIHMYDTAKHKFTFDIMPIRQDHRNATQASKIVAGVNGKIYSYATMDATMNGLKSVVEFDPDTNTTRFWGDIPSGGDVHRIAADDKYIYVLDNPYGERTLRSIDLVTGEIKEIITGGAYTIYQRKYGVVMSLSSTWWWVHDGNITQASRGELNTNPPWGFDDTNLYMDSEPNLSVAEFATKPNSLDTTSLIPTGSSTTGTLWYKNPTLASDTYLSVDFPNVVKHQTSINRLRGLENGKILGTTYGYSGYAIFDPLSTNVEHYIPVQGRISNYGVCTKGLDVYITGYFAGSTLKYDSNSTWDNAKTAAYNPNNTQIYTNPKYLDLLGSVGNIGKAFGCSVGSDNLLYIAGENVRSGTGGGMATYDPLTKQNLGIKLGYEDANVRNVVSLGHYMITSSYSDTGATSIRVAVYDINESKVIRTIYPTIAKNAIFNNVGRLAADKNDTRYVYIYTTSDDALHTRIIKVNIVTGAVLFDRSYPFESSVGGYNDSGASSFVMADDGFLYAYMGKYAKWLIRIDSQSGDIEPVKTFNESGSRFDIIGDELYMSGGSLKKIQNFKVVYGF